MEQPTNHPTNRDASSNPVYISHIANTFEKGMYPTILPPAISKFSLKTGFFNFGLTIGVGQGKLNTHQLKYC